MIDLKKLHKEYEADIDSVTEWCNEIYLQRFDGFFADYRILFKRFSSKDHPITDAELTTILMNLPVTLFDISEELNKFQISQEVVKLKNKQREQDLINNSIETTATKKKELASYNSIDDKILAIAYTSITERVSSEISFCRELIMSAKKIWDSRRNTEQSNPIGEIDPLPDYVAKK
jgi:hypothetical protein